MHLSYFWARHFLWQHITPPCQFKLKWRQTSGALTISWRWPLHYSNVSSPLVTNIPEHSKDELPRLLRHLLRHIDKVAKIIVKVLTGVKIDHADWGIKTRASYFTFQCSTHNFRIPTSALDACSTQNLKFQPSTFDVSSQTWNWKEKVQSSIKNFDVSLFFFNY